MENISAYLKKFHDLLFAGRENTRIVKEEIEKYIPIVLEEKDIEIKNGVVFIKSTAGFKSELFLKKNAILEKLHSRGLSSLKDLR